MNKVVTIDPNILNGTPVFENTRVPVRSLIDYLEQGKTINEFSEDFPSVEREKIMLFLEYMSDTLIKSAA